MDNFNQTGELGNKLSRVERQLESMKAEAAQDKIRASAAVEEATELRRELLDQQSQRALMASDGANELEKLRDQLVRLRDESEASERKLMGQLTERSGALATTLEELQLERNRSARLETATSEQREAASGGSAHRNRCFFCSPGPRAATAAAAPARPHTHTHRQAGRQRSDQVTEGHAADTSSAAPLRIPRVGRPFAGRNRGGRECGSAVVASTYLQRPRRCRRHLRPPCASAWA